MARLLPKQGCHPSHPTAALAGIWQIAPSPVQQRTMSRTERIPTVSPPSRTIRWRKPPRTIAAAASSSDQSGDGLPIGILARADRDEDVALGDDPRAVPLGIHHDRRADLALAHQPGDRSERVPRPHSEHHPTHAFVYLHWLTFASRSDLFPGPHHRRPLGDRQPGKPLFKGLATIASM